MLAQVTYPYRDRESGEVRYLGDAVELSEARFAELSAKGLVERAGAEGAGVAAPAREAAPVGGATEPQPSGQSAAELRAAIEAKGGYAPKKATKGQLASILGSL